MIKFDLLPQKPQSSCFGKWYSWKAVKNRVALDQSNDDPAGRAEQLKESPGERWELLTATEDLLSLSPFHSFSPPAEASRAIHWWKHCWKYWKALITERRGAYGGGKEGKEMKIPCASETFPVQFNMLHQLFLICCFLHKIVHFYIKSRFHRVRWLNPVQVE